MTLKLTIQQAEQLYKVFVKLIIPAQPTNIAESLLKDLMIQVFKKLRSKLEGKCNGMEYKLTLADVEAKAYCIYFTNHPLSSEWHYEGNFIDYQIQLLKKQYA
jgi:hypothetical protein